MAIIALNPFVVIAPYAVSIVGGMAVQLKQPGGVSVWSVKRPVQPPCFKSEEPGMVDGGKITCDGKVIIKDSRCGVDTQNLPAGLNIITKNVERQMVYVDETFIKIHSEISHVAKRIEKMEKDMEIVTKDVGSAGVRELQSRCDAVKLETEKLEQSILKRTTEQDDVGMKVREQWAQIEAHGQALASNKATLERSQGATLLTVEDREKMEAHIAGLEKRLDEMDKKTQATCACIVQ